jgi:hypothetical protein
LPVPNLTVGAAGFVSRMALGLTLMCEGFGELNLDFASPG